MKHLITIIASLSCLSMAAQTESFSSLSEDLSESWTSPEQELRMVEMDKEEPTENPLIVQKPQYPKTLQDIMKKRSKKDEGQLEPIFLIADVYGGYSNFRCERVSPKSGIGFGCDIGVQGEYKRFWDKIPDDIFGEFTIGYSCRGSGAFPLHCIGARFLPVGYRYELNTSLILAGKAGIYLAYPFSGIETSQRSYNSNFDCGFSAGLGVEWKEFGLMASYEHGFMNVIDAGSVELFNQGAFLTLSYKFLSFK